MIPVLPSGVEDLARHCSPSREAVKEEGNAFTGLKAQTCFEQRFRGVLTRIFPVPTGLIETTRLTDLGSCSKKSFRFSDERKPNAVEIWCGEKCRLNGGGGGYLHIKKRWERRGRRGRWER